MVGPVSRRPLLIGGALLVGSLVAGCGSGSGSPTTASPSSSSATTAPSRTSTTAAVPTTEVVPTTAAAATSAATCPTLDQANSALGGSYGGPIATHTEGGGIVCEYTGGAGNAGVTIFAHQSAAVFAGQVAHAPGAPGDAEYLGRGKRGVRHDHSRPFNRECLLEREPDTRGRASSRDVVAGGSVARVALADN